MSIDFALDLDDSIQDAIGVLKTTDKRVQPAIKRAIRKTLQWLSRQVAIELKNATALGADVFKRHRRIVINYGDFEGRVWIGLDPLPAHEGKVSFSKGSSGAVVNGKSLAGTFVASVYSSTPKVWIRSKRNAALGHAVYNARGRYKSLAGAGRYPVEVVGIDVDGSDQIDDRLKAQAMHRFNEILHQEINFVLNVEGK